LNRSRAAKAINDADLYKLKIDELTKDFEGQKKKLQDDIETVKRNLSVMTETAKAHQSMYNAESIKAKKYLEELQLAKKEVTKKDQENKDMQQTTEQLKSVIHSKGYKG
jgi:hypothetical protein